MPYFIVREADPPCILGAFPGEWAHVGVGSGSGIQVFWTLEAANRLLSSVQKEFPDAKVVHEGVLERLDTLAYIAKQRTKEVTPDD